MNRDAEGNPAKDEEMKFCSLCFCSKVNDKASGGVNQKLRPDFLSGFVSELTIAAEEGCPTCSLVLDAIATWFNDQTVDPSCLCTVRFHLECLDIMLVDGMYNKGSIEVMFSPQYSATVDPIPANNVWRLPDTRELSGSTSSDSTFLHLADLMANCESYHESCNRPFSNPLPKRIIEIATGSVYLREAQNVSARYACLSHCWGPLGPASRLTKASLRSLCRGLAICQLPQTFRDAVVVCQSLGISYIWIDALCIIQDSLEDWEEAANTMADIYENACITIAAVSAADSTQGLFSSDRIARRLLKHPQFYAKARMPTLTSSYGKLYFDKPLWPLLSRAWVYQERCLSPRVVYFGNDQIYWQCRYMFTSEDNRGLRIWERESGCDWRDWTKDPVGSWREIIREYSVLQLTYEKDRLPAIAAVASRMSLLLEPSDVYLAGMWKNSLISDLCWCCDSSPQPRPERRVPSWSWASTQRSQIHFYEQSQHFNVNVVSLTYNIVGRAYLGAVENCKLVLRGYVLPLTETRGLSHENISDIHREIQDQSSFMFAALRVSMQSHGFVLEHPRFYPDYDLETAIPPFEYGASLKLMFLAKRTCFIGGVVLRQLFKDSDEYERIGFISSTVMSNSNKRKIEIDRILQSVPIEDVQIE